MKCQNMTSSYIDYTKYSRASTARPYVPVIPKYTNYLPRVNPSSGYSYGPGLFPGATSTPRPPPIPPQYRGIPKKYQVDFLTGPSSFLGGQGSTNNGFPPTIRTRAFCIPRRLGGEGGVAATAGTSGGGSGSLRVVKEPPHVPPPRPPTVTRCPSLAPIPTQIHIQQGPEEEPLLPTPILPPVASGDGITGGEAQEVKVTPEPKEAESQVFPFPFSIKERMGSILDQKLHTDVIFMVGPTQKTVEAHRLLLCSMSPVFETLLYESKPLIEESKLILYEPEHSIGIFEMFIRCMYTGEIPSDLTLNQAYGMYLVAKKYETNDLKAQLLERVLGSVRLDNVFDALNLSIKGPSELSPMTSRCWKLIEEETEKALEQNLGSLTQQDLLRVVERDVLNITEPDLYQAIVTWATGQCKQLGVKPSGKTKRKLIDPLLKHIRFTTMHPNAFHDVVLPSRILEVREIGAITSYMATCGMDSIKVPVPYNLTPRGRPQPEVKGSVMCLSGGNGGAGGVTSSLSGSGPPESSRLRISGSIARMNLPIPTLPPPRAVAPSQAGSESDSDGDLEEEDEPVQPQPNPPPVAVTNYPTRPFNFIQEKKNFSKPIYLKPRPSTYRQ